MVSFGIAFYKNILPIIVLKLSAKRVLNSLWHIFNRVNRGIVQKANAVGT